MKRAALAVLAAPLLVRSAAACAVCFGKADGAKGLIDGIWWGIVLLIAVTMSLVSAIGYALYAVEKNKLANEAKG